MAIGKHVVFSRITAPVLGILSELVILCLLVDRLLHHLLHGNAVILIIVFIIIVFIVIILVIIVVIVVCSRSVWSRRGRAWCGGWLRVSFWITSWVSLWVGLRFWLWRSRCWSWSWGRLCSSTTT